MLDSDTSGKGKNVRFFTDKMLWTLFLPLMAEQFLKYTVGIADSMMVSGIGEAAISGVSLIDFVISLFNSLFTALAIGGSVVVSQYIGKGLPGQAGRASLQLLWLNALLSLLVMLGLYLLRPFILGCLFGNLDADVESHARVYLDITALSLPFLAVYSAGAAIFRCAGNTVLPMKIMLGMNLLNVVGNAVFIYGLDMETAGAAWSTLLSRFLSAVLVCFCLFRARLPFMQALKPVPDSEERYREEAWSGLGSGNPAWIGSSPGAGSGQKFRKGKKKIADASILGKILKVGFPYGFENCMFYMGRILVLGMVASFGTSSIAANSVAGSIVLFQVLPGMAIVAGMPVVIARCVGAGDYAQAKFYNRKIIGYTYLCHIVSCLLVLLLLPLVLRVYGLSDVTALLTRRIVWLHALFTLLLWPLCYVLPTTFRASGDVRFPMWVSILSMIFCRLLFSWIFGIVLGGGVVGIWLGMFVDWFAKGVVSLWRYFSGKWMEFRLLHDEQQAVKAQVATEGESF